MVTTLMKKSFIRLLIGSLLLISAVQPIHANEQKVWVYVVSNGDSLWNITTKFLKKIDYYTQLQKLNKITHPKKIQPGSVIRIPMEWIRHAPASARIAFMQGDVTLTRNNQQEPLTSQTVLTLGDKIQTGKNASTTVVFADGSEMVLFKNTIVKFDHLSAYGKTGMVDTRVRIIQGKVETNAQKNKGPGSRLDILTPSAISSVRGTVYRVSNTPKNISTVEVIEGNVAVAGKKSSNAINVATAQGTRIEKGVAPTKPIPLLTAPKIITTQTYFEHTPTISWHKIDKAQRYNIQVSSNKNFKNIVWAQTTSDSSITFPELEDAIYYYRITAIDKLGLEGLPINKTVALNLSPAAPALTDTPQLLLNSNNQPTLRWSNTSNDGYGNNYTVEIATDEKFTQPVIKEVTSNTQFALPADMTLGQYFWRVTASRGSDKGPASTPLSFNLTTTIAQPTCASSVSDNNITTTWASIKPNQTMLIQVAQNAQFTQLLSTEKLTSDINTFHYNTDNDIFIRCKVHMNNSNIESSWSHIEHISQADKGILSIFALILIIILI